MLRPCRSSQGHGTTRLSRDGCGLPASVRLLLDTTRSSPEVVIRSIPISDASGQCETEHRLSWTRKIVVAAHYKKNDLLHCWTSSSDIPGYHADTALLEQGRGAAWHVWMNGTSCCLWIDLKCVSKELSYGLFDNGFCTFLVRPNHIEADWPNVEWCLYRRTNMLVVRML
jgi:hypothetical protein